jgi:hypothetical protein
VSEVQRGAAINAVAIPSEVLIAQRIEWDVLVDAYLTQAAKVGARYAASVFMDRAGLIPDGTTVATPEVRTVGRKQGFVLLQSLCGNDHYVIANWLSGQAKTFP